MSKFFSTAALVGAGCWIVSELLEVAGGGSGAASLALTTVAFATLSLGVWGLDGEEARTRSWTVACGLASAGFALMALVAAQMGWLGLTEHDGMLFVVAVGTFTLGVLGVGGVSLATGRHPRWVGLGFTIAGLAALVANAAELGGVVHVANVSLAGFLAAMAAPIPTLAGLSAGPAR